MVSTQVSMRGYDIGEELYNGLRTIVYRASRKIDQKPVVIKLLKNSYPRSSDLVQFRNQYTIAKSLNSPLIIQAYSLEPYENGYALVMEDFGGISLSQWRERFGSIPSLIEFLQVAIALCNILDILIRHRIIHKDIKPANILIHPETKQVKLIDFSIASLLPRETQMLTSPNVLEGTLGYLSPEQTGRMNRGIDYRTDFYSLGVTFYELLTGQLPFLSKDAMELVHCHIAKLPDKFKIQNSKFKDEQPIPQVLGDIVMKLMVKNAEDRYQSALGLKYDLETCLAQFQESGRIESFQIGRRDVCDRFLIPEKLYGREQEVQRLLAAYDRVTNNQTELMLVTGFSGVGKTAIVNEVHKPIVRQRGFFIKGKFDQFNRNIPLSAFVQAFRDLIKQLLCESDTQLAVWKTKILTALSDNGQVMIEVIPELEQIIGSQPPLTELSVTAMQNRFYLLFQNFIQVFSTKDHPLVIFLDDLQWADLASLKLMQLLMSESEVRHLLLIGTYRDSEVSAAHPLTLILEEIGKAHAIINRITLAPLSQASLNQLVADTLSCSPLAAQPLTQLVDQKTKGNPFFSRQFLKGLYEDGLIQFDADVGNWQCDIAKVKALALTDDVVEFMAIQLQKLPNCTQNVLKLAACIGNQFDLTILAIISEQSKTETAAALWQALLEGFILPQSEVYKFYQDGHSSLLTVDGEPLTVNSQQSANYRFLHDRVQQAAYSLIFEEQKQATHLHIGTLLLRNSEAEEREEYIFEIVNHLNIGSSLITELSQRIELAQLNLMAGCKAKAATAYAAAITYLTTGISLLPADAWNCDYNLTLALHTERLESACLNTDFDQLEPWGNVVLQHAHSLLDQIKVYETRMIAARAQGQFRVVVHIGLQVLQLLGIEFPEQPTPAEIGDAAKKTGQLWSGRSPLNLLDLPRMSDPHQLAVMQILTRIVSSAYVAAPALLPLLTFKQVESSILSGNCPISVISYADYGFILCGVVGDIDSGYEFGNLALSLLEKLQANSLKSRACFVVSTFIQHWKEPLRDLLPRFREGYQRGLETGDWENVALNVFSYCQYAYFVGRELSDLANEMDTYRQVISQVKQTPVMKLHGIYHQTVLNLLGRAEVPYRLRGKVYDHQEALPHLQAANDQTALSHAYFNETVLCYLFGQQEEAAQMSALAEQYNHATISQFKIALHSFYDALIHLALYRNASTEEQFQILERVQVDYEKLQRWASYGPFNHQQHLELIAAERFSVLGDRTEAIEHYDRAIALAKENEYLNEEALANELAAKFYLDWGKEKVAQVYMQEAFYCYARWGAKAKTDDLESRYPQLLDPILQAKHNRFQLSETYQTIHTTRLSSGRISNSLDFATILKASLALSSEIQLEQLLSTLMQVVMENTGAKKAALLILQHGNLTVEAVATTDEGITLGSMPLSTDQDLPLTLVNHVKHSLKTVVLDDATGIGDWEEVSSHQLISDPYLIQQQPKSVLCTPILHQGQCIGLLYLENQLTVGAFTSDRIEVIQLLCAQAAISLQNAILYQTLQDSVAKEREKATQLAQSLADQERSNALLIAQQEVSFDGILVVDENRKVVTYNQRFCQVWQIPEAVIQSRDARLLIGFVLDQLLDPEKFLHTVEYLYDHPEETSCDEIDLKNGRVLDRYSTAVLSNSGDYYGRVWFFRDISDRKRSEEAIRRKSQELEQMLHELKQAQLQMVQSEKMATLGNLVAGVGHEINNPIGFLQGSMTHMDEYIKDLLAHLHLFQQLYPTQAPKVIDHANEIDLEFLADDLPKLVSSMAVAIKRITEISTSLRTFSRADTAEKVACDLHEGIESTLLILKYRLKANENRPAIRVITEYGQLPPVKCFLGQLNQVFMNILANAIDALEEHLEDQGKMFSPQVLIRTEVLSDQHTVIIRIKDNGSGMPEEIKARIFDHQFTTKKVGKGTGLGLAIARQIVEETHRGHLSCNSVLGEGTEFVIEIPV